MSTGRLYGIGLGPGDPELVTLKAVRLIGASDVVAYPSARHGRSIARRIAAPYLRADQIEIAMVYPVTTETTDHPGGYDGALAEFYDATAEALTAHLDAGRDVAVLCEGDPFFYGSYAHMHDRLAHRYPTEVVPAVTSVSAAAAASGRPLVRGDEVLTVAPGILGRDVLAARLATADAAAIVKLGRTFPVVRDALGDAGLDGRAVYVERASSDAQRMEPVAAVDPRAVPYMSLVLVPSRHGDARAAQDGGSVAVVGLGPAGPEWLTPEAHAALAAADDLVGYGPYLDRVPHRRGQRRHATDNRVEAERARQALALAAGGSRVAVVSSGDPGVFAMASAVLEALAAASPTDRARVRIVPGVSAMQAVAARAGAPLGHDFCVISLSDRLKQWEVIASRLEAAARADMVVAVYNPASRTRVEQVDRLREVMLRHRDAATPVVVARDVGGAAEAVSITGLGQLTGAGIDMRTMLIIGSSTTRRVRTPVGEELVYTPRRYPV